MADAVNSQQEEEGRRRGSQIRTRVAPLSSQIRTHVKAVDQADALRRRARCIHGEVEDVWITEAYTNRHGSGAAGRCGRGHKHLFSLTQKEYRAVSGALGQPRLL